MAEFTGLQGKLKVEQIKEDNYVHLINERGGSVASISTSEEQYPEALVYATLFSKAPEMLEMLQQIADGKIRPREYESEEKIVRDLIKSATELS